MIPALGHSYDDDNVCETCGFAREMITVYFENNWAWVGVKCFTWGGSSVDSWPGVSAYLSDYVSEGGAAIYYAQIWNDVDGLIWNGTKTENGEIVYNEDGSEVTDQTPDIKEFADGTVWYMAWDEAGACNTVGTYDVSVFEPACEHEYFYACDAHCMHCGELTNEDAAHSIIKVEAVEAVCGSNGNVEYYTCEYCGGCWLDEALTLVTNRFSVITFKDHNIVHVEAVDATCFEQGNVEYWYCSDCETVWADEALTQITNHKNVIVGVAHSIEHVEAKAATCYENGNIEYWYCTECGYAWTDELLREVTNLKSVILPISHSIEHVEAKAATCYEEGNIEYWYCTECGYAWTDELLREVTNLKNVVVPMTHDVIHVEAVDATCFEQGNVEYWYCSECDTVWADEALTQITNHKNVIVGISHSIEHVEAKAATCFEEGNIEYWYCTECGAAWTDELLREVTNLKSVITPAGHNYVGNVCTECGDCENDVVFQGNTEGTAFRMLTYVGDLANYSKVTFKVTIGDKTTELACTKAYTSVVANGEKATASSVFGDEADYFVMYTLTGVTETMYETEITVSVVWTAIDGTETEGEARTIAIGDLF